MPGFYIFYKFLVKGLFVFRLKKLKYFFLIKRGDGGRTSLIQGTTDICEAGHISTNIFVLLWVVIGDQELLSVRVMVDGE